MDKDPQQSVPQPQPNGRSPKIGRNDFERVKIFSFFSKVVWVRFQSEPTSIFRMRP